MALFRGRPGTFEEPVRITRNALEKCCPLKQGPARKNTGHFTHRNNSFFLNRITNISSLFIDGPDANKHYEPR